LLALKAENHLLDRMPRFLERWKPNAVEDLGFHALKDERL
jgi:hypothetical protein